jgi:histidinol-phosphate/aromatic aminotransferase/cobyric acid decarboxylase-like protein
MLIDATMSGKTTAEILAAGLEMERIFLKSIKPIHGRDGYFRVTPGVDEENERFVRFVRNYFGKK